jgi:SAM-dependent methyltransferase
MGPIHAWGLGVTVGWMDRIYGFRKRELFADLPDTIVEIGPGPGTNLRYYRPGTRVIAVEPSTRVHARLRREAERREIELDLHSAGAERLELEDASVDAVVATLVLCSVGDPREVLGEVRRVLRPGGRFFFLEHVAADPGTRLNRVQGWLRRPWAWALDGCELRRNTGAIIRAAGFSEVSEDRFAVSGSWMPVSPHLIGVATR